MTNDILTRPAPDGFIVVDKPQGWTSHDVVARVRRIAGTRRVGHAGTLDPMATGVLPVGVGLGTRVIEYLLDADKAYRATVRLGVSTDTDDAEGAVIEERDWRHVDEDRIRGVLARFTGEVVQTPPAFSAIKQGGVPLYKLARAGRPATAAARRVVIHSIRVLRIDLPDMEIEVSCSKGTYIRALARDIGSELGCGAHLATLRRLRTGPFDLVDAHTLDEIADAAAGGALASLVLPPDTALLEMPALVVDEADERLILTGRAVTISPGGETAAMRVRVYAADGSLIALARQGERCWLPDKVLATP